MPNLLDHPLLRATAPDGAAQILTLPQTLHRMMQDDIASFDGLRPHQEHAWHSFLTQLSVIAITGAARNSVPGSAEEWREAVASLTPDESDWELIRDDFTKPAFMQPPAPDKKPADKSAKRSLTPDQIDITFANKNFETKQNIIREAEPDHWIHALITAQTMSAYGGAGHPAASRMNGGYSSRPAIGLAPQGGPGARLRRDIETLLQNRDCQALDRPALLWTLPWNGTKSESLDPSELHPLYIEVCRRIRLIAGSRGRAEALRYSAAAPRVDSKSKNGVTGDPWTPLSAAKGALKPLHLNSGGFTPGLLAAVLLDRENWHLPALLKPSLQEIREGPMTLVAKGAAGGKCETNGYHFAQEIIRPPLLRAVADPERAKEALGIAEERRRQLRAVRGCLSRAIETRLSGADAGNEASEAHKTAARRRAAPPERTAEANFLRDLQEELAAAGDEARQAVRQEWLHGPEGPVQHGRLILAGTPARDQASAIRSEEEFESRIASHKNLPGYRAPEIPSPGRRQRTPAPEPGPGPAAALAPALSETLARAAAENPLILGRLKRMNPDDPQCPEFDALTAVLGNRYSPEKRARWALIVQGMAGMTVVNAENARFRQAHREGAALGRVMAGSGNNAQTADLLPPDQAEAMLSGNERSMRRHLKTMLRRLAAAGGRIDWAETAQLILEPEDREIRRKALEDYRRARRRGRNR